MATSSQAQIALNPDEFVDITVANAALADAAVLIQYLAPLRDGTTCEVICADDPDGLGPIWLRPYDSIEVTAEHIWVRGTGTISATLI